MGAPPPSQFAKVVARRRQGGILQLPCSLGFRLAFSATGGARLRPPAAFEKSGRKPAGKLFWVCNGLCRRAAHGEQRARLVCGKAGRERVVDGSFGRRKIAAFPGGRRARTARTTQERGHLAPAPALVWRALRARQTPPPPSAPPTSPTTPCASAPPPALRRLARRAGRSGRPCGGGGVQGPRPKAPAPEHARSRACPAAGGWASPTRRRPPPLGFPPTPKRQRKNPAFRPTQPRHVHHPEKGGSDREPLRNSYPKATAASPVAGYGLRPPTVAVARLSPCAQHQSSRRKGAGLFPGGRAHETLAGRVAATPSPLWQSRCPRPTGSGGFIRPAAGCCRRAASPPVARRSLPA